MKGHVITRAVQAEDALVSRALIAVGSLTVLAAVLAVSLVYVLFRLAAQYRRQEERDQGGRFLPPGRPVRWVAPPLVETEPGAHLGWRDECELIWSMPSFGDLDLTDLDAGLARLRAPVRDEQRKGDQA